MTSNPKKPVTIVLPDQRGQLILRPARVFVGDVELPVKSVDVDLDNGDVDLTLSTQEVRIVREAPAPAKPENMPNPERAKPRMDEFRFKADPRTFVISSEGGPGERMRREITFASAAPGDGEAVTVSVTLPAPKPGTSPTGCKCSACDPRGAR